MTREDREIEHYQLVVEDSVGLFNDRVNGLISDGFQFLGDSVRAEESGHGTMTYRTEMVRYAPERILVDPRELLDRNMPTTGITGLDLARGVGTQINTIHGNAVARDDLERMETEPVPVPTQNPPHWTVDSPDPFDDDDVFDEETVNEHQLNRMGMAEPVEVDDRPRVTARLPEAMIGELAGDMTETVRPPNETLIRAARQVAEGQRATRENDAGRRMIETHTEVVPF